MELKRQLFRQNLLRSRAFTQITLDDDCIVKDNKPDLLNIIHTRGSVIFEDVKVSSQTVWVTGQLRFVVLYRSEDNRLESFTDSINFGEKIFMDEVEERDTVNLSGDLEDLNISAINSRKLAVRALLGIHAVCEVPVEEEIVSGVENDPDIQQKSRTMQLLALTSAKKDILRVHSDIALPQSSPNIGHLLYDYVEVRNRQVICTGEQMQIQGEVYVNVLYSSPEGKMEWYETMVPFSESIEGGMTGTQPICWVHCQTKEYEVEPAEDYDGEMRALSLNLSMDVEMKLWEERNVELLADVYSLETNLVPQKEMVCAKKLLIKNEAKLRISEQMKLAEEQERILQLCSFEGHAEMDHVELVENGLEVEGILTVDILYATTDDSFPIAHTQEQIPFTQIVDVPGMKGSDSASTAARCCGAPPNRDAYFPIPVSYDRSLLKGYKFVTKPIIPHFPGTSRLFCISTIETADFQQEFTQFSNICGKYPLIHGAAPPSARRTGRWRQTRSRGAGDRWSSPPAW